MESESIRNIRTPRDIKSGQDILNSRRIKTTNGLAKTERSFSAPALANDRAVQQILAKERRRALAFEGTVARSQQRMLIQRKNLAGVIKRNQALMELRHCIQDARRQNEISQVKPLPEKQPRFNEISFDF